MKNFYQLFLSELKTIYDAETQIVKAFPEMIQAACNSKLKEALQNHLQETTEQVSRLKEAASSLDSNFENATCEAMKGLIQEAKAVLRSDYQEDVKDAAIIGALQRIEHYEIAVYGTLKIYAKHLKLTDVCELLEDSLKEEINADKVLSKIAEGSLFVKGVNDKACENNKK